MRCLWMLAMLAIIAGCARTDRRKSPAAAGPATRPATRPALTETQRIEWLIATTSSLKDAVFVRNNAEYDGAMAAWHMRRKWDNARDQIRTAEDFILHIASRSSASGQPYKIRFKDGTEVESGQFLMQKLKELDGQPSTRP